MLCRIYIITYGLTLCEYWKSQGTLSNLTFPDFALINTNFMKRLVKSESKDHPELTK